MGREIRMVIPNWEHPKKENGIYHPMHDEDFDSTITEWYKGYLLWKNGKHPNQEEDGEYWDYEGSPPDPEYCRPFWKEEDATWFQMYETVSEGTPVTPPFATKEELVNYLVENGTFWDKRGWLRENAEKFVASGWAPSFLVDTAKGTIKSARDGI